MRASAQTNPRGAITFAHFLTFARQTGAALTGLNNMKKILLLSVLAIAVMQTLCMERGVTELGQAYVSGGVGVAERSALAQERSAYELQILTATQGSGDFLADVHIRITDSHAHQILDTIMDGPELLVAAPFGTYEVEADRAGRVQRHTVIARAGAPQQTIFYFENQGEDNGRSMLHAAQVAPTLP